MQKEEIKAKLLETNCFDDNEWLDKYVNLVVDNRLDKHIKRFSQQHHIVPRSVYKELNIPVDNSKENLYELKFSIHILAHIYLTQCAKNENIKHANTLAYKWMASGKLSDLLVEDVTDSELDKIQQIYENDLSLCGKNHPMYGKKRPDLAKRNKEHPPCLTGERNGMYGRKGELSPFYGIPKTAEAREKMSLAWDYDKHVTPERRAKQQLKNHENALNKTGWYSKEAKIKTKETKLRNGTNRPTAETKAKLSAAKSRAIICITTKTVYKNCLEAGIALDLDRKLIAKNCKNQVAFVKQRKKRANTNFIPNSIEYTFKYFDEYQVQDNEDIIYAKNS